MKKMTVAPNAFIAGVFSSCNCNNQIPITGQFVYDGGKKGKKEG
jgi:hypothetical protein